MKTEKFHRKLTAILSADVQGYSHLMEEDEDGTVGTLTAYRTIMSSLIQSHSGHVVDTPGDNLLAEFGSAMDAVRCAVEIQEELRIMNAELPEERKMPFRIGINLGDVIEEGDHIYGNGINVAARLEGLAEGGGICISGFVYGAIKDKLSFNYDFIGEHIVKNIKDPVRVYRIRMEPDAAVPAVKGKAVNVRIWQRVAYPVAAILILGSAAIWFFYFHRVSAIPEFEEGPKTIAVLPFVDLSPENDQGYFVDGLSEELISCLTQIPDLEVTSSQSSFTFKNSDKTIQEIAETLGREYILEGCVRKVGNDLRITARLVHAADDHPLWSETYGEELKDILAIQEDIANSVADKLKLTFESLKLLGGTDNIQAYELYLVAKGQFNDDIGFSRVLESINAAITMDPEFALAWAAKANFHIIHSVNVPADQSDAELDIAQYAALRAIETEPDMAAGYYSLGGLKSAKGDFIGAELAYQKALDLTIEPSSTELTAPTHYLAVGNIKKAKGLLQKMLRNDSLNTGSRGFYVLALGLSGNTQQAELEYARGRKSFGDSWAGNFFITMVRSGTGNINIACSNPIWDAVNKGLAESPQKALTELHRIYTDNRNLSAVGCLIVSAGAANLGEPEFAMDAMEKAITSKADNIFCLWFPKMREVRQLPRFKQLVRKIGLVDYWEKFGWPDICHPLNNGDFACD